MTANEKRSAAGRLAALRLLRAMYPGVPSTVSVRVTVPVIPWSG